MIYSPDPLADGILSLAGITVLSVVETGSPQHGIRRFGALCRVRTLLSKEGLRALLRAYRCFVPARDKATVCATDLLIFLLLLGRGRFSVGPAELFSGKPHLVHDDR